MFDSGNKVKMFVEIAQIHLFRYLPTKFYGLLGKKERINISKQQKLIGT